MNSVLKKKNIVAVAAALRGKEGLEINAKKKVDGLFTLVLLCPTHFCYLQRMVAQYFKISQRF